MPSLTLALQLTRINETSPSKLAFTSCGVPISLTSAVRPDLIHKAADIPTRVYMGTNRDVGFAIGLPAALSTLPPPTSTASSSSHDDAKPVDVYSVQPANVDGVTYPIVSCIDPRTAILSRVVNGAPKDHDSTPDPSATTLEIIDFGRQTSRLITMPTTDSKKKRLLTPSTLACGIVPLSKGRVLTMDIFGSAQLWEVDVGALSGSLGKWQSMVGESTDKGMLKVEYRKELQRHSGLDASKPKHGMLIRGIKL